MPLDCRDVAPWCEDLGARKMEELRVWKDKIDSNKERMHINDIAGFSYNYPSAPSPHDVATDGYIPAIY